MIASYAELADVSGFMFVGCHGVLIRRSCYWAQQRVCESDRAIYFLAELGFGFCWRWTREPTSGLQCGQVSRYVGSISAAGKPWREHWVGS